MKKNIKTTKNGGFDSLIRQSESKLKIKKTKIKGIRKDIINVFAELSGQTKLQSESLYDMFVLSQLLVLFNSEEKKLKIKNFGIFKLTHRPSKKVFSKLTNREETRKETYQMYFKTSIKLKQNIRKYFFGK